MKKHTYTLEMQWTGNTGKGTKSYTSYERNYQINIEGKPTIEGTSDPAFRGDPHKHNPEDMLLASLSSCHMLWYLHLCSEKEITVIKYLDRPVGTMIEESDGSGKFSEVILQPEIAILEKDKLEIAEKLHQKTHEMCFIAKSMNFPVSTKASVGLHF